MKQPPEKDDTWHVGNERQQNTDPSIPAADVGWTCARRSQRHFAGSDVKLSPQRKLHCLLRTHVSNQPTAAKTLYSHELCTFHVKLRERTCLQNLYLASWTGGLFRTKIPSESEVYKRGKWWCKMPPFLAVVCSRIHFGLNFQPMRFFYKSRTETINEYCNRNELFFPLLHFFIVQDKKFLIVFSPTPNREVGILWVETPHSPDECICWSPPFPCEQATGLKGSITHSPTQQS